MKCRKEEKTFPSALLRHVAQGGKSSRLIPAEEAQLEHIIQGGYAPLLYDVALRTHGLCPSATLKRLLVYTLAAKAVEKRRRRAVAEIIDACSHSVNRLTLLKGISICNEFYPEPHWRAMGDVDLLVAAPDLSRAESILKQLGYVQTSCRPTEFYRNHHHSMPFQHPSHGVRVELHTALFPPSEWLAQSSAFQLSNVLAESRLSDFNGRAVYRLSPELQVVYVACHAIAEKVAFRSLFPFLDIIFLLQRAGPELSWDKISSWLSDRTVSAYVCVVLTYLVRHRVVELPPAAQATLQAAEKRFGRLALKILHGDIDRYALGGRSMEGLLGRDNRFMIWNTLLRPCPPWWNLLSVPWNLAFPPMHAERFRIGYQRQRLRSVLRRFRK